MAGFHLHIGAVQVSGVYQANGLKGCTNVGGLDKDGNPGWLAKNLIELDAGDRIAANVVRVALEGIGDAITYPQPAQRIKVGLVLVCAEEENASAGSI